MKYHHKTAQEQFESHFIYITFHVRGQIEFGPDYFGDR